MVLWLNLYSLGELVTASNQPGSPQTVKLEVCSTLPCRITSLRMPYYPLLSKRRPYLRSKVRSVSQSCVLRVQLHVFTQCSSITWNFLDSCRNRVLCQPYAFQFRSSLGELESAAGVAVSLNDSKLTRFWHVLVIYEVCPTL